MTKISITIDTPDLEMAQRIMVALAGGKPAQDHSAVPAAEAPAPAQAAVTEAPAPAPVAPPVAEAPTPASAQPPVTEEPAAEPTGTNGVELDAEGLPWDARIHASTKTKKADGCWKAKRGVSAELVQQVTAELRQLMALPAPAPATEAPAPATEAPTPATEAPAPTPVAPPAPQAPTAEPAPADFMSLVGAIGRMGVTQDQIQAALQASCPGQHFQALAARPDLIPGFWAALQGA